MQEEDEDLSILECPICFEQMVDIALPCSVPDGDGSCTHSFCMGCMQGIYSLSQNHGRFPLCPICRRQINSFVRNQLASTLVTYIDKMKVRLRDIRDTSHETNNRLSMENESMARRMAELEGELVKANNNNQGESERNGHMRKMLHLLESEKTILSEHLEELRRDMDVKVSELENTQQQRAELEQLVRRCQEDNRQTHTDLTQANARYADVQALLAERDADIQRIKDERRRAEDTAVEFEDRVNSLREQAGKAQADFDRVQKKVIELEQVVAEKNASLYSQMEEKGQAEKGARELEVRLQLAENELAKRTEDVERFARRLQEVDSSLRKTDSERANSSLIISQLNEMLNKYKQETKKLEEEKYACGRKIAELEGAVTKYTNHLQKSEEEKVGYKERAWKAERDADLLRKELERIRIDLREKEDIGKSQDSYFSGLVKKSLTLNPLSAIWGEQPKQLGPLIRNFSDIIFYERRGSKKDGRVWRAVSRSTAESLAIKKIANSVQLNTKDSLLFREALILHKIEYPSIIRLEGVSTDKTGALYFLYSPFVNMDLEYAVRAMKLNALQIKSIMRQLLLAVCYLHRQELAHRNIKPTSVLLSEDCSLRLCGFSHARSLLGGQHLDLHLSARPINYVAPEVILSESAEFTTETIDWKAADIWSVGCIFAELIMNGAPIFEGSSIQSYAASITKILDCRPSDPSEFTQLGIGLYPVNEGKTIATLCSKSPHLLHPSFLGAEDLLKQMLKFDASSRLTAVSLLQHQYFADVLSAADINRGRDVSREVTDNCLTHFINEFCAGVA